MHPCAAPCFIHGKIHIFQAVSLSGVEGAAKITETPEVFMEGEWQRSDGCYPLHPPEMVLGRILINKR
jgi:hypothetical protein